MKNLILLIPLVLLSSCDGDSSICSNSEMTKVGERATICRDNYGGSGVRSCWDQAVKAVCSKNNNRGTLW